MYGEELIVLTHGIIPYCCYASMYLISQRNAAKPLKPKQRTPKLQMELGHFSNPPPEATAPRRETRRRLRAPRSSQIPAFQWIPFEVTWLWKGMYVGKEGMSRHISCLHFAWLAWTNSLWEGRGGSRERMGGPSARVPSASRAHQGHR